MTAVASHVTGIVLWWPISIQAFQWARDRAFLITITVGSVVATMASESRASVWNVTVLTPTGASYATAFGVFDGQQAGEAVVGGRDRASLWSGTAASWVDLNPAAATSSRALGTNGGHQVGVASVGAYGDDHASLWSGTAASWVDLNPPGTTESTAYGVNGDWQG